FRDLLLVNVQTSDGGTQTVFAPFYGEGVHKLAIVLERASVLILAALSATVAFQAGMFSIGMDGQLVLGAITVGFLGYWLPGQIYAVAHVDPKSPPEALFNVMHLIVPVI